MTPLDGNIMTWSVPLSVVNKLDFGKVRTPHNNFRLLACFKDNLHQTFEYNDVVLLSPLPSVEQKLREMSLVRTLR